MTNLTIVIPAKNEAESLPIVLDRFIHKNYKVCVVLEESDLKTIKAIENKNCDLVFQSKKGFGNALREGIDQSDTEYFCIFNADGSMEIEEIDLMLQKIEKTNDDIIFASRYEKDGKSDDDTIVTWIGNKIFTFITRYLLQIKLSDILFTYVVCNVEKFNYLNLKN